MTWTFSQIETGSVREAIQDLQIKHRFWFYLYFYKYIYISPIKIQRLYATTTKTFLSCWKQLEGRYWDQNIAFLRHYILDISGL